ncbi:hypothetical protein H7H78_14115 [Mycobacterium shinjukuense]|uniref:Uncharacterized protein n=1 Tax=Mycobacterium shinjukuense TaxID=398694 RepID=A0A7I7MT70_9MYCO|nr:hypothetical protein [Mycobacterium shinjukuense]MCV6986518.1 hypothetical protein [Mycobacterium shinjukuense]ORB70619.1 hypothetical protein BST45_05560 [Mycobacterium shinjukuense]BBX75478.1 hypothetical protein MSHI_33840 [Mycobacterium shinjukuense]
MNVGDSVRQSLDHWARQEWERAIFHACDAVNGTGKKRYPQLGVATRFKRTIRDSLDIFHAMAAPGIDFDRTRFPIEVKSDLPDGRPDIADVLFGIHRYTHGHVDELPKGFELTRHGSPDVGVHIWRDGKIQLPAGAILGLLAIAVFAPENKGEAIPINYQLSWYQHNFQINGWWGWQDHFREIISGAQFSRVTLSFDNRWDDWSPI